MQRYLFALVGLPQHRKPNSSALIAQDLGTISAAHRQPTDRSSGSFGKRDPPPHVVVVQRVHEVLGLEPAQRTARRSCSVWTRVRAHSRKIGLEHQDRGGVLEVWNGAGLVDVRDDQLVGFPDVCAGADGLAANDIRAYKGGLVYLWCAAPPRPDTARMTEAESELGLRALLMGTPMGDREEEDRVVDALNSSLLGVVDLLPRVYGDNEPCRQAVLETGAIVDMDASKECVACKRAMLLYALYNEPDVRAHWARRREDGSAALARDLSTRVLPFIVPRFFKESCQVPEAFVLLALVMSDMWAGEQLGNWSP